jgi:5-methylcytosine-specific restriction endonuclease McrA
MKSGGGLVSASVLSAAAVFREALAGFEPGVLSGGDCARIAEELAATEKACGAARLLAAARAVELGAHRSQGSKDGASWLARTSGATGVQARQALETARRLEDCPDTKAALLAGDISLAQAGEIAQAQSETRGAERVLLPVAREGNLSELRDRARAHRQSHTAVGDLHRQQHQARFFRHWRDRLGLVCFAGALPPETGLPFIRRIELATHRARRNVDLTKRERWEAHAADALATLGAGQAAPTRSDRAELVIVCDLFAWRRGHSHTGEACHLIGGGPIPVALAKDLAQDAFVAAVLSDGVQIHTVKRFGRYLPAELRTALDLGPVPEFTGRECADCGQRWGLQYDHVDPVAHRGPTSYANIEARCWTCHRDKTERDRQAGLLGPHAPRAPNRA